ncbi:hypothetical protein ACWDWV_25660, partial [Streptosporangium sandarakinum]
GRTTEQRGTAEQSTDGHALTLNLPMLTVHEPGFAVRPRRRLEASRGFTLTNAKRGETSYSLGYETSNYFRLAN